MRIASSFVAAALLASSATQSFAAAQPCMRSAEKAAFDIAGLKSELMVIAIDCQVQDKYNAFVVRFRPDLQGSDQGLNNYFQRTTHHTAQAHDDYITSLANAQSDGALTRGTLFCSENMSMFDKVMALGNSHDLVTYASSQKLRQPIDVVECPAPAAPAKKAKTASATSSPVATKAVASQ
jgi:hypothetical protein